MPEFNGRQLYDLFSLLFLVLCNGIYLLFHFLTLEGYCLLGFWACSKGKCGFFFLTGFNSLYLLFFFTLYTRSKCSVLVDMFNE